MSDHTPQTHSASWWAHTHTHLSSKLGAPHPMLQGCTWETGGAAEQRACVCPQAGRSWYSRHQRCDREARRSLRRAVGWRPSHLCLYQSSW